jgi:hypothetical protein
MTDMTELAKRKLPLNLAIVHVDPDGFLAAYRRWLEITKFILATRLRRRSRCKRRRNDEPFIANMLQLRAPAVEIELDDDFERMVRSLAQR